MLFQIAGYLSGVISLVAEVPYFRDIFRGLTRPARASGLIFFFVDSIAFFSQLAKGASYSLWMAVAFAATDLAIFFLAFKYGYGKKFLRRDGIALSAAGASLVLWYWTRNAAVALFMIIAVEASSGILVIIKSYEAPGTETTSKWALIAAAGLLACVAVGKLDFVLLAFPAYITLQCLMILAALYLGSRRDSRLQKV